jgi:outer membrane lipoprotein-sorting protein
LSISRLELYGSEGALLEDIHYTDYRDFGGIRYPAEITLNRPEEDYTLSITIEKATFNQPIPAERFVLKRPPNTTLLELRGDK